MLNVFLAIAVDNLADADSLTTIEKEDEGEGEAQAEEVKDIEGNVGPEDEGDAGNMSRRSSRRSRRRSAAVGDVLDEEEEERLHKTWNKRSKTGEEEDVEDTFGEEGKTTKMQLQNQQILLHLYYNFISYFFFLQLMKNLEKKRTKRKQDKKRTHDVSQRLSRRSSLFPSTVHSSSSLIQTGMTHQNDILTPRRYTL